MKPRLSTLLALFTFAVLLGGPVSAQDADGVYTKVDVLPVPQKTPPPEYPQEMKRDGTPGIVAVLVVIDETGAVSDVSVSKASHPSFEKPSLKAVKNWRFKPAKVDGKAVKVRVTLPLRFSVND